MISGTGDSRRAFSLLEILIVLAILVLFSGFFLLRFDDSEAEELLSRSSGGVQALALKAKKRAYAFRREHYLIFTSNGVALSDSAIPGGEEGSRSQIIDIVDFPTGVRVEIQAPGESKLRKLNEFVWTFRDSGLNDPLRLRFSVGRSYTDLKFNVLTARAEEESFLE